MNRPSAILEAGVIAVAGPMLAFSMYLLFAGHNQPGGGFAAGLVAGVTVLLVWAAGGTETVRRVLPVRSTLLMGLGLVVAAITGFAALVPGLAFLESGYIELAIPVVGKVKIVSALFFDIGVYLVVVGMALGLIRSLGEEEAPR
ncbi:MAG: MnhB domain-containing protein [Acidimicrobiia bacterium]|nr:MnhB domain-containing protein [Acidimicrobiia bacterium]MDX2466692.1 MnhB domain-containing protein [Acidimicrobiia bacterium]